MNSAVDIVVERQWHAPALAKALAQEGALGSLYTGFPKQRYLKSGVPAAHLKCHPFPALWNYGIGKLGLPKWLRKDEAKALAASVAGSGELSPVVTCLATSYQELFPKLVHRKHVRVIECGSMHPEDHFHFNQRARREAGLETTAQLPKKVAEEIEISKLAHFLVCGSRMVVDSYVRRGYDPERVLLCPYGVDTARFRYQKRDLAKGRPIQIATVGVIGIRKGIQRLLRLAEFARDAGLDVELHLIGPVEPEAESLISRSPANCVRHGVLKGEALVNALHQADVYCLPSYEEGFPISQLEAMATGLPAISSNDTGGREAISPGIDGEVLTAFDRAEFDSVLLPWLSNPERILSAGLAASQKVGSKYSLACYAEGVSRCYGQAADLSVRLLLGEPISNAHPAHE